MQPSRELPPRYELHGTLDISKSRLMAAGMNMAAAGSFFLFGWMALQFLRMTRSDAGSIVVGLSGRMGIVDAAGVTLAVAVLVILQIIAVVLHEAAHGAFFWYFTRERPVFGLKLPYAAYAAAPDWYLPRSQHLVVGLAPFVLITLAGLAASRAAAVWHAFAWRRTLHTLGR